MNAVISASKFFGHHGCPSELTSSKKVAPLSPVPALWSLARVLQRFPGAHYRSTAQVHLPLTLRDLKIEEPSATLPILIARLRDKHLMAPDEELNPTTC
jgi:hypothetical protein